MTPNPARARLYYAAALVSILAGLAITIYVGWGVGGFAELVSGGNASTFKVMLAAAPWYLGPASLIAAIFVALGRRAARGG